jgi:hypothetical protein
MATLNFKFVANDAGLKDGINQAKGHLDDLDGHTGRIGANVGKAFALMGAALLTSGLISGLKDMVSAAQEDEIAQRLLATQLENTVGATKNQITAAEDFITAMSRMAGVSDDVLRPALSNAVRGTGSLEDAQKLLTIALDGSAASGKPLDTVLSALIKAHNGNETALYKLAPELKKTKGNIDDFAESVKGAAAESRNPFEAFKISVDEAKEALGARLLPVFDKLVDKLMPLIDKLMPAFTALVDALMPVIEALIDPVIQVVTSLTPLLPLLAKLIIAITPLISELLPPLVDLFVQLLPVIIPIVDILTDLLVPIIKILAGVLKSVVGWVADVLAAFTPFAAKIQKAFEGVGTFFKGLVNGWTDTFEGFVNGAIDGLNGIIRAINLVGKYGPIKFSIGTIGHISIPKLATGGIVMPTPGGSIVNVAEAGKPEAIIPLDRLGNLGGNTTVNVYVDQAVSAQTIIDVINKYSRNTGTSVMGLFA